MTEEYWETKEANDKWFFRFRMSLLAFLLAGYTLAVWHATKRLG